MMHSSQPAVLIVEPDAATRELYARALRREYRVVECAEAQAALALVQGETFGAIVLEPSYGDERGWQALAALREHTGRAVPLVLCSVLDERRRGMALGAAAYLVKPVLPARLLETLRAVMEQNHATNQ